MDAFLTRFHIDGIFKAIMGELPSVTIWIPSHYRREISYFSVSPRKSLAKLTAGLMYANSIQTLLVFFPGWALLRLGPPDLWVEGSSGLWVLYLHTWLIRLSQHSSPRTCLHPPQVPLLLSSGVCLGCTQLLSGRISRRKPYDLLIRFPKDSVKLKSGSLNSHKHQGMHQPKSGLSLRTGSSFLPLL